MPSLFFSSLTLISATREINKTIFWWKLLISDGWEMILSCDYLLPPSVLAKFILRYFWHRLRSTTILPLHRFSRIYSALFLAQTKVCYYKLPTANYFTPPPVLADFNPRYFWREINFATTCSLLLLHPPPFPFFHL